MSNHFNSASIPETHFQLWPSTGWRLLRRTPSGQLTLTDDFLRNMLNRPELTLVAESCQAEVDLHDRLQANPRFEPSSSDLSAIQDEDARANIAIWLRFRARLMASDTVEAAYMQLFQGSGVDVAPTFVQLLTQVLLANVLSLGAGDAEINPVHARAAEMLFRTQKISIQKEDSEGHTVMAADDETVERQALSGGFGSIGELLRQGGAALRSVDLDVLSDANASIYWERGERHDLVLNLNHGQAGLTALCRVLEAWIAHFHATRVGITVSREIDDERWVWHVGLDAQSSTVLNALYRGDEVDAEMSQRMLSLFTLNFVEPADMRADIAGRPVYLAMAMDGEQRLKLKPQNLLLNLPLALRS